MERHRYVEADGFGERCNTCGQAPYAPVHQEPTPDLLPMDALWFAEYVAQLTAVTRDLGLIVPSFQSRPGPPRTVRWLPGGAIVTVSRAARPARLVKDDLIEGVCVVNMLHDTHPKRALLTERIGDA
jgi:hypothetical protein